MNDVEKMVGYADEREALLAKVLATENISVVNDPKATTASFDVARRVLYLPVIEAPIETRFLFVFHEISHALFTPVTEKVANFVYNVVEDVRVDSKITMKYPGARRFYSEGIKFLVERGFFGQISEIANNFVLVSPKNFLSRVNLYSKIRYWENNHILPSFEDAFPIDRERELFAMIDSAVTFGDVEDCVAAVMEYINSEDNQNNTECCSDQSDESGVVSSDDDVRDEVREDEEISNNDPVNEIKDNIDSEASGDKDFDGRRRNESFDDFNKDDNVDVSSDVYKEAMSSLSVKRSDEITAVIGDIRFKNKIPTIIDVFNSIIGDENNIPQESIERNVKNVKLFKKAAANMAKEFQLRQRSRSYASRSMRNSGQIDPNLLSSYKFSEDIFKNIVVEKNGNNYGLVLIVDRSLSMLSNICSVYQQVALLAEFCRLVGIKLVVYGYTNTNNFRSRTSCFAEHLEVKNEGEGKSSLIGIIELISTDMPSKEFSVAFNILVNGFLSFGIIEGLYQTPTNDTLIALAHVVRKWKERNRIDICRTFLFTDGVNNQNDFLGNSSNVVVDIKTHRRYNAYNCLNEDVRNSSYRFSHLIRYRNVIAYDIYRCRSGSSLSLVVIGKTKKDLKYAFSDITVSSSKINDTHSLCVTKKGAKNGEFYRVYNGNDIGIKARGVLDNVAIVMWNVKSIDSSVGEKDDYNNVMDAVRSLRERSYAFAVLRNISRMYIDILV